MALTTRTAMRTQGWTKWAVTGAAAACLVVATLPGCELIVDFNRSLIPEEGGATDATTQDVLNNEEGGEDAAEDTTTDTTGETSSESSTEATTESGADATDSGGDVVTETSTNEGGAANGTACS